jgi:ribosomal protein S18 acetylase RimI-like enzyme
MRRGKAADSRSSAKLVGEALATAAEAGCTSLRILRADYRVPDRAGGNPHGSVGYVFSVATAPDARRRGYARACMETLLDWFREKGAAQVDLNASAEAEPLTRPWASYASPTVPKD